MPRISDKAKAKGLLERSMVAEILFDELDSLFDDALEVEDPTQLDIESLAQGEQSLEAEIYDEVCCGAELCLQ